MSDLLSFARLAATGPMLKKPDTTPKKVKAAVRRKCTRCGKVKGSTAYFKHDEVCQACLASERIAAQRTAKLAKRKALKQGLPASKNAV